MPSRLQPALFGGLFIGILSSLPFISALNACCCLWVIAGGVLTTYLLQEGSPVPVAAGPAAVSGLLAGGIGAIIAAILSAVLALALGGGADSFNQIPQGDLPPEFGRVLDQLRSLPPAFWYIAPGVIFLLVFPVFGMLGALLGVAVFKRNLPPVPPQGTVEILPPE